MINSARLLRALPLLVLLAAPAAWSEPRPPAVTAATLADGQHDFDFEFGAWKAHLARRLHPLSGSNDWVEYEGTSTVRKVWDGRADLGELEVDGPKGHIEGLSLRLYNPSTRQWNITWANAAAGVITPAMIGGFHDGIGEFYGPDDLNGRAITVRFIFFHFTADSFQLEQAYSADGGKTWEANWIADFTKISGR